MEPRQAQRGQARVLRDQARQAACHGGERRLVRHKRLLVGEDIRGYQCRHHAHQDHGPPRRVNPVLVQHHEGDQGSRDVGMLQEVRRACYVSSAWHSRAVPMHAAIPANASRIE
eukprot:8450583-Pyramimonas_sp.AAC.1